MRPTEEEIKIGNENPYSVENLKFMFYWIGFTHEKSKASIISRFTEREFAEGDSLEGLSKEELTLVVDGLDQMLVDEDLMGSSDIMQAELVYQRDCYKLDRQNKEKITK